MARENKIKDQLFLNWKYFSKIDYVYRILIKREKLLQRALSSLRDLHFIVFSLFSKLIVTIFIMKNTICLELQNHLFFGETKKYTQNKINYLL